MRNDPEIHTDHQRTVYLALCLQHREGFAAKDLGLSRGVDCNLTGILAAPL